MSIQLGISSSQLLLTPSFFRGVGGSTTNQDFFWDLIGFTGVLGLKNWEIYRISHQEMPIEWDAKGFTGVQLSRNWGFKLPDGSQHGTVIEPRKNRNSLI